MIEITEPIRVRIPTKLVRKNGAAKVELNVFRGEEKRLLEQALGQDERKASVARQTLRTYCGTYLPRVAAHLTRDLSIDEITHLTQEAIEVIEEPDYFHELLSLSLTEEEQQIYRQNVRAELREGERYLTEDNSNQAAAANGQIVKILQVLGFSPYPQKQLEYMLLKASLDKALPRV